MYLLMFTATVLFLVLLQCERIWWFIEQNLPVKESLTDQLETLLEQQSELRTACRLSGFNRKPTNWPKIRCIQFQQISRRYAVFIVHIAMRCVLRILRACIISPEISIWAWHWAAGVHTAWRILVLFQHSRRMGFILTALRNQRRRYHCRGAWRRF